jgi:hypothetical protein
VTGRASRQTSSLLVLLDRPVEPGDDKKKNKRYRLAGLEPARGGGGGAPKSANPMVPRSLPIAAGASRRARSGDLATRGPRFRLGAERPVAEERTAATRLWRRISLGASILRSSRAKPGSAKYKSSASSWQGFLVSPGGAPLPPECRLYAAGPQGAAPHPASRRLAMAPLAGRGGAKCRGAAEGGDKFLGVIPAEASIQLAPEARKETGPRLSPG